MSEPDDTKRHEAMAIVRHALETLTDSMMMGFKEVRQDVSGLKDDVKDVKRDVSGLSAEQRDIRDRVGFLESEVKKLKEKDSEISTRSSSAEMEQQAAVAGVVNHMAKIDSAVHSQGEKLEGLVRSQIIQTTLLQTILSVFTKNIGYVKYGLFAGGALYGLWKAFH